MLMVVMNGSLLFRMPLSKMGLAHFDAETKHETKPNLPNSADTDSKVNVQEKASDFGKAVEKTNPAPNSAEG
jgi:hypothetical protein